MPRRKKTPPRSQPSLHGIEPPQERRVLREDTVSKVTPEISFIEPPDSIEIEIPEQKEHFQLPTRFGAVLVDEAPLGWEVETRRHEVKVTKFQHAYPTIRLPFQEVQRVTFGHTDQFSPINTRERE